MVPFKFVETLPDSFFDAATAVIDGRSLGVICRSYVPDEVSGEILRRFLRHPQLRRRMGDAEGAYLGTFHWRKPKSEYLAECRTLASAVESFSPEWNDAIGRLNDTLATTETTVRPATWERVRVATPLVRSWEGDDDFALVPHEDASQCTDPIQAGFEAQEVARKHRVCSLNLCIANSSGGELQLWNHVPTPAEKLELGTSIEGGPYPTEFVKQMETTVVPVHPGDLYIFNGSYLHAVRAAASDRATISCLLGRLSASEVVTWT